MEEQSDHLVFKNDKKIKRKYQICNFICVHRLIFLIKKESSFLVPGISISIGSALSTLIGYYIYIKNKGKIKVLHIPKLKEFITSTVLHGQEMSKKVLQSEGKMVPDENLDLTKEEH